MNLGMADLALGATVTPLRAAPSRSLANERKAWAVAALSFVVMAAEIVAGAAFNSIALISDGIHTCTHVAVMVMAACAYIFARRRADDPRFVFGAGKAVELAGFASGVGLAVVAFFIALESVERLIRPEPVAFAEAAGVAGLGLLVGLFSALLLKEANRKGHPVDVPAHRDLNLWAAYLHMIADVITSVLTIAALCAGAVWGWMWLDSAVGLLNAAVVGSFSIGLLKKASAVLLDMSAPRAELEKAAALLESRGGTVLELKMWAVGSGQVALFARMQPPDGQAAPDYKSAVQSIPNLKVAHFELRA